MEHNPRMLLMLEHQNANFFIGELDKHVKLTSAIRDEQIRGISDFKLDLSPLRHIINSMGESKPTEFIKKDPGLELIGW